MSFFFYFRQPRFKTQQRGEAVQQYFWSIPGVLFPPAGHDRYCRISTSLKLNRAEILFMNQKTNILKCMRKRSRASEIQGRGLDWSRSLICNANLNGNIFFFSTCWLDLRRQERLMNDYRNQEAEAQGEKHIFFSITWILMGLCQRRARGGTEDWCPSSFDPY